MSRIQTHNLFAARHRHITTMYGDYVLLCFWLFAGSSLQLALLALFCQMLYRFVDYLYA